MKKSPLIGAEYLSQEPILHLINKPNLTEADTTFTLNRDTKIQIYAVGEMDIKLTDVPRPYLFKSDDIELFFSPNTTKIKTPITVSWLNGSEKDNSVAFEKDGFQYESSYNNEEHKYHWLITMPWKHLTGKIPEDNDTLDFDVAIGDNDDGSKQKAKIAWYNNSDPLINPVKKGLIRFVNSYKAGASPGNLISVMRKDYTTSPGLIEWAQLSPHNIENLVEGEILKKDDLAANIKSCWDFENVYLTIEILDSRKGFAKLDDIKKSNNFHDYAWIEDNKGHTIWKMNALYSKHSGGALKNQQIDTAISLKAGKYHLKYATDESHSWNNWDDSPPLTNFTGIVIYAKK